MYHYALVYCLGGRETINQMFLVDVSVQDVITTTTTRSNTVTTTSSDITNAEGSLDSHVLTDITSMFSTSMVPPQPTPSDQEAQLITTASPTIKEDPDEIDDMTEKDIFELDEPVLVITETQMPKEATGSTASTEDPDDHSVIEISTILPDVLLVDDSLSTAARFAEGKTEKTVVTQRMITDITSDVPDTPTESAELTSKKVHSSSDSTESIGAPGFQSTTSVLDYDRIMPDLLLEAPPPLQPFQQIILPSSPDSTIAITSTTMETTPPTTVFNHVLGNEISTTETSEAFYTKTQTTPETEESDSLAKAGSAVAGIFQVERKASTEDVTLSTTEHTLIKSNTQRAEDTAGTLAEDQTKGNLAAEIYTFSATSSDWISTLKTAPSVDLESQMQNTSGMICILLSL